MKVSRFFLITVAALFLMASTAMATPYQLIFDADGTGVEVGAGTYGFHMETANGTSTTVHQTLGADGILNDYDAFYESFSLTLVNGLGSAYGGLFDAAHIYADNGITFNVSLTGIVAGYSSPTATTAANAATSILDDSFASVFLAGAGSMMQGSTTLATFSLFNSTPAVFSPSVFTNTGAQANISLGFVFNTVNSDYFATASSSPTIQDLVGQKFLLALVQGNVGVDSVVGDATKDPDEILFGIDDNGFDAKFQVVPEPGTILLLGFGLLGIAGVCRKRTK